MKILQVNTEEKNKDELEQQYKKLQQFWDSCKQSKPRTKHRCSTDKTNLYVLNISPRVLMSSLQQRKSPTEGGTWRERNDDLAAEEIRMGRREAIESGKFQGRRLFEENHEVGFGDIVQDQSEVINSVSHCASGEGEIDDNGGTKSNGELNVVECCEHCYYCSSSSSSSLPNGNLEGKHVNGGSVNKGRWKVLLGWLVIALILFSLGIVSVQSFDGSRDQNELILVPT